MTVNIHKDFYAYRLTKVFPYDARGISGCDWYIYKKSDALQVINDK